MANTGELAEYLYSHSKEDLEKEGLASVNKRLRPHLEVLGGLIAEGMIPQRNGRKGFVGKLRHLRYFLG